MKVLHFYKTYYPDSFGGVEQVIYQLAEGGIAHGVNAEVLSLSRRPADGPQTIGRHTAWKVKQNIELASNPFSLAAVSRFKALSRQADIIHYHFPWPFMDMVDLLAGVNRPRVVSYHSDIIRQQRLLRLYRPLMNHFLGKVDSIVATSPNYVESSDVLQKYQHKVSVIPIGIDRHTYPAADEQRGADWLRRIGQPYFLFIGKLRYYKGLHFLIDAAAGAPYPVVIVGSGPEEEALKQQALQRGAGNIQFVGELSEEYKMAVLCNSYGLVFPSHLRSEAFGVSLLEGAMAGKPLISCEIGTGTTYINIDRETGLVVPPRDVARLRQAMDLLWRSPELANQYGQAACRRFETLFTADKMAQQYAQLYQRLHR